MGSRFPSLLVKAFANLQDKVQGGDIQPQNVVGEVVPGDPVVGLGEGGEARVEVDELGEVLAVQNSSGWPRRTSESKFKNLLFD